MRSSETKKRNMIIGSLLGVLLLMVVGYAAFSSVLNINGTSGISSNWKILITNIEEKNIVGGASTAINEETKKPEITGIGTLTATFKTNLVSPGDSIEYDITVTNQGSIDAKLDKITPENLSIKDGAIIFTRSEVGFEVGDVLKTGESKVLTVKVEYDESVTSQPESTEGTFTVTLDYSQNGGDSNAPTGGKTAAEKLIATEVTSGDGIYTDETETGRYIYKGSNPDNYITFNDETWRIMSVESDGTIKIIRNENLTNRAWDASGNRDGSTSTYCIDVKTYGCNAWASTTNLVNNPAVFTVYYPSGNPNRDTTKFSGTVTNDSSLNTYLNEEYYNSLHEASKNYVINHNFNVGSPGDNTDTEDIAADVAQEALFQWSGKVGLMSITDILKTTTNTTCTSLKAGYDSDSTGYCNTNNWMWTKEKYEWTISPYSNGNRSNVWNVMDTGFIGVASSASGWGLGVRPVIYLTPNITLDGEGTSGNPYTIITE